MTSVGGIRSRKSSTKIFSGELRTEAGSLTTSVFGLEALEQMRRGDIGHVEGRILAEMDDVELCQIDAPWMREAVVVAGPVFDGETVALAR